MPTKQEKEQWIAAQLRQPHGEDGVQVGNMMNKGNRMLYERVFSFFNLANGAHIVEIGMGNGAFVKEVLSFGENLKYSGCDFSELMVTEAKRNNDGVNSAEFILTDASKLPFEDSSIDCLFTLNTIYFWEDKPAALKEFCRVLKPEGHLLIGMRPKRNMGTFGFTQYGFDMLENEEVESLLNQCSFKVLDILDQPEAGSEFEFEGEILKVESLIFSAVKK